MTSSGRQVGIEVEFAGVEFDKASEWLSQRLGVACTVISPHEHLFETSGGRYRLEVDFDLLKKMSREQHESDEQDFLRWVAVEILEVLASVATPLELVSPPIPVEEIPEFDSLLDGLVELGATGTGDSLLYAFGVHFNPSAELDARSITSHLRAFVALHDWLKDRDAMELSRVISAYATPYPEEFERIVLARGYAPTLDELIDTYLEHNPTRNRALDLLPLFAEIDETRVRAVVEDELVSSRPTYHYRLPNSRLGEPDWNIARPWSDWLEVEAFAADPTRLEILCEQRLAHLDTSVLTRHHQDWMNACQNLVENR